MAHKSKLVEEKINKLLTPSEEQFMRDNFRSPMLQKLYGNQNENVRKLRDIFEGETAAASQSPNNSGTVEEEGSKKTMRRKSTSPSTPTAKFLTRARQSFGCLRGLSPSASPTRQSINKTERIVNELIEKEREYIATLEKGIENYVRFIDNAGDDDKCDIPEIPQQIRHERFKLFGNIEEICLLHKMVILPEIVSCSSDVQRLADTFIRFLQNDTFYPYISYAICYINGKEMALSYKSFFHAVQRYCGDPLGVFSFILQPIQKLTRYPLMIEEIIKDLSRDMHENKNTLASLCVAKKKLERYLDRMNQSLKLNDIVEAHQLSITLQFSVLTSLQIEFGVDVNEPTFLIVPTFSNFADFQAPFNVFDFGKFIKTESMECHELRPTYRFFYGEVFVFEKYLMYTKKSEGSNGAKSLLYRDKFKYGSSMTMELRQDERTLTIADGTRAVSFTAKTIEKILQFNDLISNFYDPRKSSDSAFFELVAKPTTAVCSSESAQYKKDQALNNRKDKLFEDADNNDEMFSADALSQYEYNQFKSDSDNDDDDDEQIHFLQIANSRFYVQSD